MKAFAHFLALTALVSCAVPSFAAEPGKPASAAVAVFRERGSILGIDLKAVQAALPEFEKRGLKIDGYKVIVSEDRDFVVVVFDDPQRPPGQMGSTTRMPTFEVTLKRSDLSVVSSNFAR